MRVLKASPEEQILRDQITFREWGAPLSLRAYLDRQQVLRSSAWAKKSQRTWLLKDRDGKILSSCDVFQTRSCNRGETGVSFGIANVVTEEQLRGNRYSQQLLTLVMQEIEKETPGAHAFYLLSEVGEKIYGALGFKKRGSFDRVFLPSDASPESLVKILDLPQLNDVLLKRDSTDRGCFQAEVAQFVWHFDRQAFYARELGRSHPSQIGVRLGDSYAVWFVDFKYEKLRILKFSPTDTASADSLLQAAQSFAHAHGLKEVRVWDTESKVLRAATVHNRLEPSDDGILMFRLLKLNLSSDDEVPRVIWV